MRFLSPLRYPGGKGDLANFLEIVIERNNLTGTSFLEPFAGGAGASLRLLFKNVVKEVYLNDADIRIFALWHSILNETNRFVDSVFDVPLNIDEWKKQNEICNLGSSEDLFKLGFACFYMNRCNRSGIIKGARPIGGLKQTGKWDIGARFPRDGLVKRILWLKRNRDRIHLSCMDAKKFLQERRLDLASGGGFVYLDPPYVRQGGDLYMNQYKWEDHVDLAEFICSQDYLHWIMTYDFHPMIQELYLKEGCRLFPFSLRYSLQQYTKGAELLIAPSRVFLPKVMKCGSLENVLEEICVG